MSVIKIIQTEGNIWTIQKLKKWAIDKFEHSTMNRVMRCYYGPKEVVEDVIDTQMDYWSGFWKLWKEKKQEIKDCGFGIIKQHEIWIIFCETKHIPRFEESVKELEEKRLKPSKIILFLQKNKLSKNDAIFQLKVFLRKGKYKKVEELIEGLEKLIELSPKNEELFNFLEELAISYEFYKIKMNAIVYLAKIFPEKSKPILKHLFNTDEALAYFFMYYYSMEVRKIVGNILEKSLLKRVLTRKLAETTWKNYLRKYYKQIIKKR